MKRTSKPVLLIICILFLALLFAFTGSAAAGTQDAGQRICKSHPGPLLTLSEISKTAAIRNRGPVRAPSLQPAVNDLPLAIIVVAFSDMPYSEAFDWSDTIFHADRSLAEFYSDMSLGQFTFTPARETSAFGGDNRNAADKVNDGVIHVTLDLPHDDWTLEYASMSKKDIATTQTLSDALCAALDKADAYLDFSSYDTDQNGTITTDELAVGFIFAGYEASASDSYKKGRSKYLWSHAWSLQEIKDDYEFPFELPAPDDVTVSSYIAISEQEEDGTQEPYATLAHELGHYIGLPDLYDTSYNTTAEWGKYSVGCLSLMCTTCWVDGDTGETLPTPLDAWSRVILGWVTPTVAEDTGVYTLTAQNYTDNSGYCVLQIATQKPGEYYLLESRAVSKWDAPMTQEFSTDNGGLLLWHIDDGVYDQYNNDNQVNDSFHRPAVMPLFPEKTANSTYTFIGKNSTVQTSRPFFDRTIWSNFNADLGTTLNLPLYGTGSNANKRNARTLSGIQLEFLSDAGTEMQVWLNPQLHQHTATQVVLQAPSCTGEGLGYLACSLCGKWFTDESCTTETGTPVVLPALGHNFTKYQSNNDASCGVDGTETATCDRCDETDTRTAAGTALTHNYTEKVTTEATCTKPGVKTCTCTLCGDNYPEVLPALGHTAPNDAGKCSRCGETIVPVDQLCPYCHKQHNGSFIQRIIAFFHQLFYTVAHLFGRM